MSLRAPAHRAGSDEPRALPAERRPPARRLRARIRTLIASCLLALVLAAGSFEIARMVLMRSFAEMDADATRQGAERARRALEADLATLEAAAERGAEWYEMYEALSPRPHRRQILGAAAREHLGRSHLDPGCRRPHRLRGEARTARARTARGARAGGARATHA